MIYLKLKSQNLQQTIDFYTKNIELFKLIGNRRLVCKFNADLILDLIEGPVIDPISFGLQVEDPEVISNLYNNSSTIKTSSNLAGRQITLIDPDENTIWISECN